MRYIQLQRILQSKMHELEKLCIRERQLLEGKWKTHSLPARKKASSQTHYDGDPPTPTQVSYSYCRPTVSTEDVAKAQQKRHVPQTLILAYQCIDPRYHYTLQSSKTNSGEYLLTFEQPRYKRDDHHFIAKTPCNAPQKQNKANQTNGSTSKNKKTKTVVIATRVTCAVPAYKQATTRTTPVWKRTISLVLAVIHTAYRQEGDRGITRIARKGTPKPKKLKQIRVIRSEDGLSRSHRRLIRFHVDIFTLALVW